MTQIESVSIFIPFFTRNADSGLKYLRHAIESVIGQSDTNWTLTVVDDRSPIDGVEALVQSFSNPKLRLHRNAQNLGQAGNWNICKSLCTTELFTILHADDELKPNYLAEMRQAMQSRPQVAALFCQADIINESGRVVASFVDYVKSYLAPKDKPILLEGESGLAKLLAGNFIMCPTVMYRKSMVGGIHFSDQWRSIPDFSYWAELLLSGLRMEGIPVNCFRYRRHTESGTDEVRKSTKIFEEESDFYRNLSERCARKNWDRAASAATKMRMVKFRTSYFMLQDLLRGDVQAGFQKLRFLARING